MTREEIVRLLRAMPRATTILDCDGTVTESLWRRFKCYEETWEVLAAFWRLTCERLRKERELEDRLVDSGSPPEKRLARFELPDVPPKLGFEAFCQAYRTSDNISDFFWPGIVPPTDARTSMVQELLATLIAKQYDRVVGMYKPDHLAADKVPQNLIDGARRIIELTAASIVSFRKMNRVDFMLQLEALGLVNSEVRGITGLFEPQDVNLVGVEGRRPYEAKISFAREHYAQFIRAQAAMGCPVVLVGDSVHDFKFALGLLDIGPVQFIGVTETGESDREKFLQAFHEARLKRVEFPEPRLFLSVGDAECLAWFGAYAGDYARKREIFLREHATAT